MTPSDQLQSAGSVDEATIHELLASVFEDLDDGCVVVDRSMDVLFANRKVGEWFGEHDKGESRAHIMDILPDHRLVDVLKRAAREDRRVERGVLVEINQEGRAVSRYFTVVASPVELRSVEGTGFIRFIIKDDTKHHETEQIRKDFVANASHELRTPLSIITGYLENLVEGMIEDPATMNRALKTMQKHGDRISRIVEDMLTISKFESLGSSESSYLRSKNFNIALCVRDVVDRLMPMIDGKQAKVSVSIPDDASEIAGDRFYWDQVFFNLIENALKENDRDGFEVSIQVELIEEGHRIVISDNGVGIPRSHLPFVFKRFYRVAKHRGSDVKGTGLGLSIVKRAVEAHGGTIGVESEPGVKTVFTILLPRQELTADQADDEALS